MIARNSNQVMHLIYPPLLTDSTKSSVVINKQWIQSNSNEIASKMKIRCPQLEYTEGEPRLQVTQRCHSPIRKWANSDRAGYRICFDISAAAQFDPKVISFIIAHLNGELNSIDTEWVHDLRALDVLGETFFPLVEDTAVAIALTPRARQKALQFKVGSYVVEQGFWFASRRELDAYEMPSIIRSPHIRTFPY